MLLRRHNSRVCRKTHKTRSQAQRIFKTAPLYAVSNPEPTATPEILSLFTAFFESLWSPTAAATEKAGMSYVYDEDGTLIADTLTGGAQTSWGQSARYIYLPTASGPMPVAAIYGTKHYAIQSDHLNTPRRLIQSDGQVAWQWAYSAFGEEKPTTAKTRFANADLNQSFGTSNVPAVTFNLRYPGQYFDQESNLHYNYHRSYSATVGRYTQADPIGLDGGWNRFGYVGQNPLSFTDPSGLFADTLPSPIAIPTLTGLCLAYPLACAGAGGYAVGMLINPIVQPIISSIIDACTKNEPRDCAKEWREARAECTELIQEQQGQDAGRRKKRGIKGVTGGYYDIEQCARGLVSEACFGNRIER